MGFSQAYLRSVHHHFARRSVFFERYFLVDDFERSGHGLLVSLIYSGPLLSQQETRNKKPNEEFAAVVRTYYPNGWLSQLWSLFGYPKYSFAVCILLRKI